MVRVLRSVCDLCGEDATHAKIPITIGVGRRRRSRTLDLCDRCYKELIQPVLDALDRHGLHRGAQSPAERTWRPKPGRKFGPLLCLAGCQAPPLKHIDSFAQHLRGIHDGMTVDEYVAQHGELVPLTPEEQAELVVEVRCDEEGCGQVYSTELGHRWPQQAMVSHMWGRHGIKWRP